MLYMCNGKCQIGTVEQRTSSTAKSLTEDDYAVILKNIPFNGVMVVSCDYYLANQKQSFSKHFNSWVILEKTQTGDSGHGISRGFGEIASGNSKGQLKKKLSFQGQVVKEKSCGVSNCLGFWLWNFHTTGPFLTKNTQQKKIHNSVKTHDILIK